MSQNLTNLVAVENGKVVTSSLKIAEIFGKEHFNVIRDIELLQVPDDFRKLNFEVSEYPVTNGIGKEVKYKAYLLPRNGFSLLCFGFTGSAAMQFKIKFLEAFNAMEEALKRGDQSLHEAFVSGKTSEHPVFDKVLEDSAVGDTSQKKLPLISEIPLKLMYQNEFTIPSVDLFYLCGITPQAFRNMVGTEEVLRRDEDYFLVVGFKGALYREATEQTIRNRMKEYGEEVHLRYASEKGVIQPF